MLTTLTHGLRKLINYQRASRLEVTRRYYGRRVNQSSLTP